MASKSSDLTSPLKAGSYQNDPRALMLQTPPPPYSLPLVCPPAPRKPSRKRVQLTVGKPVPAPCFIEDKSNVLAISSTRKESKASTQPRKKNVKQVETTLRLVCPPAPRKPEREPTPFSAIGKPIPTPRFVEHRSTKNNMSDNGQKVSQVLISARYGKAKVPVIDPPRRSERLIRRNLRVGSIVQN